MQVVLNTMNKDSIQYSIYEEIEQHPAWIGSTSGLKAEKILRGRKRPYLYLLRQGEFENDYYVTFVHPDFSIKHTPFIITTTLEGWHYENASGGGPYTDASIDDVLHLIMHCHKDECAPLMNIEGK